MTESVELVEACPSCGRGCVVHAGQSWIAWRATLAWFRSYACEHCGARIEADGDDLPGPQLRDALLRRHGRWVVEGIGPSPVAIAKALRKVLGLDLKDALDRARAPDRRCWEGTRVEAHWMQDRLRIEGAESRVRAL
ncbi:MAG: hypothetical protein R3B09_20340 [Nannocystaceae bacterium]